MARRWQTVGWVAASALALPVALALLSSGSCSLVDLYDGAVDAAPDGRGGASSSTGGAAGAGGGGDGGLDAGASDAPSPCPPDMVTIALSGDAGYCIDHVEVTNQAYGVFLAQADASAPQEPPGRCDWNVSYAPAVALDAGDLLPVLGVDWCDAYAFCRSVGRRLCGAIGGGPLAPDQRDLSSSSQWFRACSRSDSRLYPYGDAFNIAACADCNPAAGCVADAAAPSLQPVPVGSKKGCAGGYTGISDMSGNAAEWEDGCDDAGVRPDASDDAGKPIPDPRYDVCYHRGGSFYETGSGVGQACLACSSAPCPLAAELRSHHPHDVGFRCCLDY